MSSLLMIVNVDNLLSSIMAIGDVGDFVVIINTKDVVFTGKKWNDKLYRHHTGYFMLLTMQSG